MFDSVLSSVGSGLKNSHTTVIGVIVAICTYISQVGGNLPQTKGDWLSFLASLGMVALGVLAKDARTGSQPKPPTFTLQPPQQ